ncbi:hypothetical protein PABG_11921 [Paracoccidioides brasiliensis Pb03]|nr:hypothetical protein PABG_11921 [Paracoccidioides brasiliensis Pb03]
MVVAPLTLDRLPAEDSQPGVIDPTCLLSECHASPGHEEGHGAQPSGELEENAALDLPVKPACWLHESPSSDPPGPFGSDRDGPKDAAHRYVVVLV